MTLSDSNRPMSSCEMRLVALDSLRGVAALMVVLLHINAVSHITEWTIVRQGWLFVDFFFVLSGFVIAFAYLDKIENWASVLEFAIRRFGRVWPLHAFILLLFVGSELLKLVLSHGGLPTHEPAFTGHYTLDAIAANLFLVHSLGLYGLETWNGPSWSISVEFYTYLVFALTALFARRRIVIVALALIALSVLVLCLWAPLYLETTVEFGTARCLYGFFVGVLVALAFGALQHRQWMPLGPTILEADCVALVIALLLGCAASIAPTMLAPLVFAGVVLVFAFQAGRLSRLLLTAPFTWLGDRSYSIYIVHAFVIELLNRGLLVAGSLTGFHAVTRMPTPEGMADVVFIRDRFATDIFVLVYVGIVLMATELAHRTVEQPGRAFFNRLARGYRQQRSIARLGPALREQASGATRSPAAGPELSSPID
jgi:peptidoglycan/LPS O-acetylase OafA/YrhL